MRSTLTNYGSVDKTLAIFTLAVCCSQSFPTAALGEELYLSRLQATLAGVGTNLPALTESAEQAAADFLAGGNLWVAGRQAEFISEACGRAGGLMCITPLGQHPPTNHDIILYAVPGGLDANDSTLIKQWRSAGARVVSFESAAAVFKERFPLDTVANVCAMWTWTGEFVAACTRRGKMPVLYQSYGLPGGPERGKKYQGKKLHDDLVIRSIAAGVLGRAYLDQIQTMLAGIQKTQMPKITQAAEWWRRCPTNSALVLVTGHMFPRHAQDPRAVACGKFMAAPAWEDKELLDPANLPGFVLHLGYQFAPQKLVEQARASDVKLLYTTVQPAKPAEPAGNILYLDPGWQLADGCVAVPGYDVPILPASGVIQAAIYWSIVSARGFRQN